MQDAVAVGAKGYALFKLLSNFFIGVILKKLVDCFIFFAWIEMMEVNNRRVTSTTLGALQSAFESLPFLSVFSFVGCNHSFMLC